MRKKSEAPPLRGELSMGDALAAVATLGPDRAGVATIVALLDLTLIPSRVAPPPPLPPEPPVPEPPRRTDPGPVPTGARRGPQGPPVQGRLRRLADDGFAPRWVAADDVLEPAKVMVPVAPQPPVEPVQARAVMSAAASTARTGGRLDVPELIRRAARARPLTPPPFLVELRTAPAVQLLIDIGRGMEPYLDDVAFLEAQISDVTGPDRLQVHTFIRTPLLGVDGDVLPEGPEPWSPPPRGLVLMITDLGLGGPRGGRDRGSSGEWARVAEAVLRGDAVMRVLTPFPVARAPAAVRELGHVVEWDALVDLIRVRA